MKAPFKPDEGDKLKIRRQMAVTSFCFVLMTLISCLYIAFFGDESIAKNMSAISPIIITILGLLTSLILNYSYHSHYKGSDDS